MTLTSDIVREKLTEKFGDSLTEWAQPHGILTFCVPRDMNLKVLSFLYDDESLAFRFLTDLTAVHYPDRAGEELCVVYHLHNLVANRRLRMKLYAPVTQPDVYTATRIFSSANWMERETYDFYGVHFIGHPNLKRVLNVDEMDYFPLRKEFPLEDQTRIDKDDEMFGRG
ncbi:MAG: NADH-quinone oxidoreductase subunit C [Bacteroidetes bacterium]|nr:NADH-quinone oxidoreductase subunit C [Bacteroidota bacterium]